MVHISGSDTGYKIQYLFKGMNASSRSLCVQSMRGGSISGELPRAEATEENVLTLAMADEKKEATA